MEDKEGSKQKRRRHTSLVPRSGEVRSLLISLLLLIVIMLMLALEYLPRAARFEVGKPSMETVISARDFSVIDEESTEKAREAERQRIKNLFINQNARMSAVSGINDLFDKAVKLAATDESMEQKLSEMRVDVGSELDDKTLLTILGASDERRRIVYATAVELLTRAMSDPVSFDNLNEVKKSISSWSEGINLEPDLRSASAVIASAFTVMNTDYPSSTIKRDMEVAASSVQPVSFNFKVGQKIVDKGELITPFILSALGEAGALSPVGTFQQVLGICLLLAGLYIAALFFIKRFRPELIHNWRVVATICLIVLVFSLLCRLFSLLADQNVVWGYLIPLALVGLTLAVLLDHLLALFVVALGAVLAGLIVKGNFYLTLTSLLGGIAGVLFATRFRQREKVVRAGVEISLAIAVISLITASMFNNLRFALVASALGFGNGVLATLLTLGSLPVLERTSGITTNMRLLELASPDHPLMKELITKAPGTYSHSVVVGNLADAAAREIDADALLSRVGAYYHDIGKTKRPNFFVENQPHGYDGHEKINPNLSALVISAHVKEGVELARENRLPREIEDIIRQHHGTSLIRFFYVRALQERKRMGSVSESRFRYSGEKPKSKEAALVMLADAVEAAAKTIDKPTPLKLEQLIRSLIKEKLDDGQLSESRLTLGDLEKITKTFTRILSAMYHTRVEYPALVKEEDIS